MKIINQSWAWEQKPARDILLKIERAGRTCYKSEKEITRGSAEKFAQMIKGNGHGSVLEHGYASIRFITNRGATHEMVRHRLASFSQESTRYVNYKGKDIEFIRPVWFKSTLEDLNDQSGEPLDDFGEEVWLKSMFNSQAFYLSVCNSKGGVWRPEQAREILPNSLKTEIVMTCNLREWMHVFKLRTSKAAHPQIRELMKDCLKGFQKAVPVLFDDIGE